MNLDKIQQDFKGATDEVKDALSKQGVVKPRLFTSDNLNAYFKSISDSFRLIGQEPEILLFVAIQWATIVLAYFLWAQLFQWIPEEVWEAIHKASQSGSKLQSHALDLIIFLWSVLIIILASYPLAVSNAAIVAVHNLRASGRTSTTYKALALGMRYIGRLWVFTAIDAWITVSAIIDRLPSKNKTRTALDELLYYAWKISTMTVVPSLVNGRGYIDAGKDAVKLFKESPKSMLGLRLGYSAMCWLVGGLVYALTLMSICSMVRLFSEAPTMYTIMMVIGVPIVVAVGIVTVILRPPFLLGVAKLYSEHVCVKTEAKLDMDEQPFDLLTDWKTIVFIFLLVQVIFVTFFAERIGVAQWVAGVAKASVGLS